jgi:hypothetical protein
MVAQIKTITSVTEQGMQRITRAINRGASSDDLTREIDRVVYAIQGSAGQIQATLQGAITAAGADVTGQILAGLQLPQITPGVWNDIAGCMRALNKVEDLVLTDLSRSELNTQLALIQENEGNQCSQTLGAGSMKESFDLVFKAFDNKSLAEQRRKRLVDIMQLRLDIIRYHATPTQTESK